MLKMLSPASTRRMRKRLNIMLVFFDANLRRSMIAVPCQRKDRPTLKSYRRPLSLGDYKNAHGSKS